MKVLQINCVYNEGSTGKLVWILHNGMKERGLSPTVIFGRGKSDSQTDVYKVCGDFWGKVNHLVSRFTGLMYGGCVFSTAKIKRIIKNQKPDVVNLHCINGYFVNIYNLVKWLKDNQIPTVVTLHAEFFYTANCGHALDCENWRTGCGNCPRLKKETESLLFDRTATSFKKMKKAFDGFDDKLKVVSVSPWLMGRAKESVILGDKEHYCIYNSVDTSVFKVYTDDKIKKQLCPNNEKLVFHATAYFSDDKNDFKGGYWLLELAKRMKDVRFVVAGDNRAIGEIPDNVVLLGRVTDQTYLAKLYSISDVTLITSKKETFSMVVAESLCCGTPVVGFKAGAPEQIAIPEYSDFYEQGDLNGLEQGTKKWLCGSNKEEIAEKAKGVYSQKKMIDEYLNVYRSF